MTPMPGHYLGSIANFAADTPWDLEYSLVLDAHGHYQFFHAIPKDWSASATRGHPAGPSPSSRCKMVSMRKSCCVT